MDESLMTLADEVRGKTLRLLEGVGEEAARFTGPGLSNSILWHAGHALMLGEHLGMGPATGQPPQYPKGWFELFGWGSKPAAAPKEAWPALAEVVGALRSQHERLRATIRSLSDEQLARVVDPARNRTLRFTMVHGLHDEAGHQGEIHLLRKLHARQGAA